MSTTPNEAYETYEQAGDGKETQSLNETTNHAFDGGWLLQCNGFWYPKILNQTMISFQRDFEAKEGDILLASMPKSGTTWLKALVFSIINRDAYTMDKSPLLTSNPHQLVPFEFLLPLASSLDHQQEPEINGSFRPRILSSHIPYQALPSSVHHISSCKIVYICRNPLDQFISLWHFYQNSTVVNGAVPLDVSFELFFEGKQPFGPFWKHMLEYWDASLRDPKKVLFLRYEDLKNDFVFNMKKIAEFLGFPFTKEEEENGDIEEIKKLCSIQNLKNMEVNKTGKLHDKFPINNNSFFRKGEVGDWVNYISPVMAERVEDLIAERFGPSGLTFAPYIAK